MEDPVAAPSPSPQYPKPFTRLESPQTTPSARSRATTLQTDFTRENADPPPGASLNDPSQKPQDGDIFERSTLISGKQGALKDIEQVDSPSDIPEGFDELPIELISLIDRFIESLAAKVHNTPPSIDKLTEIFQEFYIRAEASIATHISSLATRQSRIASPNPSISSKSSATSRDGSGAKSMSRKSTVDSLNSANHEQQMLTPLEISERRKARRLLDRKGTALEEAVERRVCERVYNRIWRHRSTLDEVRDEKLRSRTAALALVGIGLRDLGINFDTSSDSNLSQATVEAEIEIWIAKARDGLLRMNEAKYPLGKLQQLAAAHKNIVDLLTALHQGSSSADEILPTLIYTLITTPPEGINVISNLHFIQRFRAASKVDGEAAYCLVNLEAAITFLETVDLASLRADEALEGPPKSSSRPSTPQDETMTEYLPKPPTSAPRSTSSPGPSGVTSTPPSSKAPLDPVTSLSPSPIKPVRSVSPSHHRSLSNLLQPPAHALGAASDAVRNTADQGLKTIGHTLDSSFKLLFGRLQEHSLAGDGVAGDGGIVVPKTLDDVRTLVQPKPEEDEEAIQDTALVSKTSDDSLLHAIAGRKVMSRDRSVDSVHSSSSAEKKKVAFLGDVEKVGTTTSSKAIEPTNAGMAAVESMRNFGNSINPLRGLSGMTSLRGFGRSTSSDSPTPTIKTMQTGVVSNGRPRSGMADPTEGDDLPPMKVAPPTPRFMTAGSAEELKVGEVAALLQDYKRLALALDQMGAL